MTTQELMAQNHTVATELLEVEDELAPLVERQKNLKQFLFNALKKQKAKSLKLEDGTLYVISDRQTLDVADEKKAWDWAEKNYMLKIDTSKAMKVLRRELKMPKFFKVKKTEYLRIVRPDDKPSESDETELRKEVQ